MASLNIHIPLRAIVDSVQCITDFPADPITKERKSRERAKKWMKNETTNERDALISVSFLEYLMFSWIFMLCWCGWFDLCVYHHIPASKLKHNSLVLLWPAQKRRQKKKIKRKRAVNIFSCCALFLLFLYLSSSHTVRTIIMDFHKNRKGWNEREREKERDEDWDDMPKNEHFFRQNI